MNIDELDTPHLVVDLDGLEDNLDRYQTYFSKHGIGLRPHIKTHKCLAIAHMQIARGAFGITCQKLGEAEVMVNGGVDQDVLIPFNIIGEQKLRRLVALTKRTRLTVAADSETTIRGISAATSKAGVDVGVIIELDVGARAGVETPELGAELAALAHSLPGIDFRGVMAMPTPPENRPFIQQTLALLDARGLPHPIVSGGSTPASFTSHEIPELTEFRAGEYPVGGMKHLSIKTHTVAQCAARVLATVVSRPTATRAILDAGSKSMSAAIFSDGSDSGSMGHVVEFPEAHFNGASEEHGNLDVSGCDPQPQIGDRVQVIPVHPCPCFNEHDVMAAVRGDQVEAIWPVHARGMIR
ncbi:MAG: D-TA family PLP-dependent enzyme [Gemmatimonadetes bacterium]|jgi:D-serine deaminase-like pyridoxal phosphate-dependent protein|nr:D-TA family PLP-dependent enzyme [Gemmatimonadota bacterium]MBT4609963.1 D-TA family PLP-dependent enzyme [Gemmatimonadota bacterium]MBT5058388.1 D-TA family PLP-dependent enzyme [Gemmatimonadota bacterium]MBT5146899.1 D-TA family PLP-dependent enzyme [Gemmatimonadota bacterium]MBT5591174.1 D-TA family PLP-dependent enzyme [Gemmatimonadota bacterium]